MTGSGTEPSRTWLAQSHALRTSTVGAVADALGRATDVAFLNYPDIANVGDPLLWLGAREILDNLNVTAVYQARHQDFDPDMLRSNGACDMILLNGGGNFGDVWPGQHQTRQRAFVECRDYPMLQLPQSLHYLDEANLRADAKLIAAVDDVTLMWRERRSYEIAQRWFDARNLLVPDTAFTYQPKTAIANGSGIRWLLRMDRESLDTYTGLQGTETMARSWVADDGPSKPVIETKRAELNKAHELPLENAGRIDQIHREIAELRIRRGADVLAGGTVVVTDRLHGVILSVLLGIPVVALDNRSHKVHDVVDTHLADHPLVHKATTVEEANSAAENFLEILE